MSRDIRPRYKEVLNEFYTKYESYNGKGATKMKKPELKPKEIIKKIDEIAKRRSELKKIAKKEEIDKKLRNGKSEKEEGKESGKNIEEENDDDVCMVCYKTQDLYAGKCGHRACKTCWDKWLKRFLECPKCRRRTRKNQIVPLSQETVFIK